MPNLSVIICSHNPRLDYLDRVLEALSTQTLPMSQWELILIDNASSAPLRDIRDLSWHPEARHVREDQLGLTKARLRGIDESCGSLLVLVDDDNVLAPNYLQRAAEIASTWPMLGAWGGTIDGEFEIPPPSFARPLLDHLAIRNVTSKRWSNSIFRNDAMPSGAGMCVRIEVARTYARSIRADAIRSKLGRIGTTLSSGEDSDLALTACSAGLGLGLFPELKLTHLIPRERLNPDYLLRLVENISFSNTILRFLWNHVLPASECTSEKIFRLYKELRIPRWDRNLSAARRRGEALAVRRLTSIPSVSHDLPTP